MSQLAAPGTADALSKVRAPATPSTHAYGACHWLVRATARSRRRTRRVSICELTRPDFAWFRTPCADPAVRYQQQHYYNIGLVRLETFIQHLLNSKRVHSTLKAHPRFRTLTRRTCSRSRPTTSMMR